MTRRRRSRYTIYLSDEAVVIGDPKPIVLLAYGAQDAHEWATKRYGDLVLNIEEGDYRKKARHQAIREAAGGYSVDFNKLDAVTEGLGLKWPVCIRYHARIGNTHGNYRLKRDAAGNLWHDIMLKSYHDANEANNTLWHELCHALQAEKSGDYDSWQTFRKQQRKWTYKTRPMEIEARLFAEEHEWQALCR